MSNGLRCKVGRRVPRCFHGLISLALLLSLGALSRVAEAGSWRWHGGHRVEQEQLQTSFGLRVLLVNDPTLDRAELTVHVPYGSYDEGETFPGLAHLREHLVAFDPVAADEPALVPWIQQQFQGEHWFKTRDRDTLYFAAVETRQAPALWQRMRAALAAREYSLQGVQQQIRVIDGEWQRFRGQDGQILEQLEGQAATRRHPVSRFRSGHLQSLPLSASPSIAQAASTLSRWQHDESRMSLVLMAPAPLQTLRAWLNLGPAVRAPLPTAATADSGEPAAGSQPAGPVWAPAAAGRLLRAPGGTGDAVLWWLWAPALGDPADRLHVLAAQLAADAPGSLASVLKAAGLVTQLASDARPGYYGERDRLLVSLSLTEAGQAQLPALQERLWAAVADWAEGKAPTPATWAAWRQQRRQAAAQQLPSQRAFAGFELAHAMARCSGSGVFSGCERLGGAWPAAALRAAMNRQDVVAWLLPAAPAARRAWAAAWAEGGEAGWEDWPAAPARATAAAVPVRPLSVARWASQPGQTCRVSADPAQPWEGLAAATIELRGLPPEAVATLLLRAEHAVQQLVPLRRYAAQEGTRPEWSLQGTLLQLVLTGRRAGQEEALGAWVKALNAPLEARARPGASVTAAVSARLASLPGGQTYDHLLLAMRQALGAPALDPRAALPALQPDGEPTAGLDPALSLDASRLRLFLTDAPGAAGRPCPANATSPAAGLPAPGQHRVTVPAALEHSVLLQRCELAGLDRFWQARAWRPALQRALRRAAGEGADALTFVSAPTFVVKGWQCWGLSADSQTLHGEPLVQAAESRLQAGRLVLAQARAGDPQWRGQAAPAAACSLSGAWQWWREGQVLPADWRPRCLRALDAPQNAWLADPTFAPAGDPSWSRWVDEDR